MSTPTGFKEWWETRNRKELLLDSGDYHLAERCYKEGWKARQKIDAKIARDSASHNMSDICNAQNIAELIMEAK